MRNTMVLVFVMIISFCNAQTYTLEIHAAIDGLTGYCDSLLSLVGSVPGAGIFDIPDGDSITLSIDTTLIEVSTGARDLCYGWSATGSPCSTPDTCFGEGNSISFVMTGDTRFVWNFKRQFTFEVDCELGGSFFAFDSPDPDYGVHWFDSGDSITASVDAMVGDTVCVGFEGTGSVTSISPNNIWTGVLEEPSTIQWKLYLVEPPCSLIVISDHGMSVPSPSITYWIPGSIINAWITPVDSSDSALGIFYVCIGWLGEGCVPATGLTNMFTFTCTDYGTLEWLWDTVATGIDEKFNLPENISLSAYPNPFNSSISISVGAIHELPVTIEIFDIAGRIVELPSPSVPLPKGEGGNSFSLREKVSEGRMRAEFIWQPDASLTSGVYLVRAKIGGESVTKRIVYLK